MKLKYLFLAAPSSPPLQLQPVSGITSNTAASRRRARHGLLLWPFAVVVLCLPWAIGCREQVVTVAEFEPNMVYARGIEIQSGYPMKQALAETQIALTHFFGTPHDPQLPQFVIEDEEYASLVDLERLQQAAGPKDTSGAGLYQEHCSTCHGIVGNGRGETAALLDPYPRDYRSGKFKYKRTIRGAKPLRADLADAINKGIPGTAMKPIPELSDEDVEALVDYVIYLSWRGEVERALLMEGENIVFEEGEHLFLEGSQGFEDQLEFAQDTVLEIADSWLEAEDRIKEVPEPDEIPVPKTIAELQTELETNAALQESVAKGKEIFTSEIAACAKCHGPQGYGDGQTQDYDDWTKEWTVRIGVDPTDEAAHIPLIARGVLPARKILPRDFREGVYRGGSEPENIYLRIVAGIDGTPMPAATLPPEEIWHLVNYVRSLANPSDAATMTSSPPPSDQAAVL